MRALMLVPLIIFSAGASEEADGGWQLDQAIEFYALSGVTIDHDDLILDDPAALLETGLSLNARWSDRLRMEALPVVVRDTTTTVCLRRARGVYRLPGTPWIGAKVSYGTDQPFVPGVAMPVVEWGWVEPDSLVGMGVEVGGILGFDMGMTIQAAADSDTLEWLRVSSPWLGFGYFDWHRLTRSSALSQEEKTDIVTGTLDLRYFNPYFAASFGDSSSDFSLEARLRGFGPISTGAGGIEAEPYVRLAGAEHDLEGIQPGARTFGLDLLLRPSDRQLGALASIRYDIDSDSLSGILLRERMVSVNDFEHMLELGWSADGDYHGRVGFGRRGPEASSGLYVYGNSDDSLRVGSWTIYSPRRDVSARLEISGDPEGSLDPLGTLELGSALGDVTGSIRLDWDGGPVHAEAEIRGRFW